MGALISQLQNMSISRQKLTESSNLTTATSQQNTTPAILVTTPTSDKIKQTSWDPRSPTMGITRTPLQSDKVDRSEEAMTPIPSGKVIIDPRSPNCDVDRTPIVADCDVHRAWDYNHTEFGDEGDSLYVNSPSIIPVCDLDVSTDDNSKPSTDHPAGSMENLLELSSLPISNERGSQAVVTRGGKPELVDSACVADCEDEEVVEKTTSELTDNTDVPDVSPIGSPIKQATGKPRPQVTNQLIMSRHAPMSSTPNKSKARPLKARDMNSPLSIVQRKQVAKINTNRIVSNPEVILDKENSSY